MDSDQGKLFIGGISWETTEEKLKDYFEAYGAVLQTVIMRDKLTGKPRGFGFVVFSDPSVLDRVLQDAHTIDGRTERERCPSSEVVIVDLMMAVIFPESSHFLFGISHILHSGCGELMDFSKLNKLQTEGSL